MPLVTDPAVLEKLNGVSDYMPHRDEHGALMASGKMNPNAWSDMKSFATGTARGVADLPAHLFPEINKGLDNIGLTGKGADFDAGRSVGSEVGLMALGGPAAKALKYAPMAGKHLLEHSLGLGGVKSKLLSWLAKPGTRNEILDKLDVLKNGTKVAKAPETPPVAPTAAPAKSVDDGSALLDSLRRQVMERNGSIPRP